MAVGTPKAPAFGTTTGSSATADPTHPALDGVLAIKPSASGRLQYPLSLVGGLLANLAVSLNAVDIKSS